MSSCVLEDFREEENGSRDKFVEGNFYIDIKVKSPFSLNSRAPGDPSWGGFEDDELVPSIESSIASTGNVAIFFNDRKEYVSYWPLTKIRQIEESENNIELIFRAPLNYITQYQYEKYKREEDVLLGYCLVILNGSNIIPTLNITAGESYESVIKKLWTSEYPQNIGFYDEVDKETGESKRYFTLTNSAFVKDGVAQSAVPFNFSVIQEAQDYDWEKEDPKEDLIYDWTEGITVYVERMVSKITADFDDDKDNDPSTVTYYSQNPDITLFTGIDDDGNHEFEIRRWRAKLTGWGMNALEKETHYFKNLQNKDYFPQWNEVSNYRSYWSEDPHYGSDNYPWQYRKAVDAVRYFEKGQTPNIPYYSKEYSANLENGTIKVTKDNNILKNYSYVTLNDGDFSSGKLFYIPENTFDETAIGNLDNRTNVLAGSHVIVTGELQTNIFQTTNNDVYETKDVYRDRVGVYYKNERDCFLSLMVHFINELNSQTQMRFYNYDWSEEGTAEGQGEHLVASIVNTRIDRESGSEENLYEGQLNLYYRDKEGNLNLLTAKNIRDFKFDREIEGREFNYSIEATVKGGDGQRLIWMEGLEILDDNGKPLKVGKHNMLGDIPELDEDKVPKIYEKHSYSPNELKSLFYEWLGAIDHYRGGRMYYYVPIKHYDGNNTLIYGNVRNHWYKFGIVGVKEVGTSVDNEYDPIVPNKTATADRLNFRVEILDWHYVYDQNTPNLSIW